MVIPKPARDVIADRRHGKAPHHAGLVLLHASSELTYRLPAPDGVKVDPLGEEFGASVLPDGFVGLGVVTAGLVFTEPDTLPVVVPLVGEPVVLPLTAAPPGEEPTPAEPPLDCARANELESANAPANTIVMSFMIISLVDDQDK
jgi:hypothetical protein